MLNIGWSKIDITSSENLMLAGHHKPRLANGVYSNLYATAVTIDDTVICSVDLLNVPMNIYDAVRELIPDDTNLVMVATHNHSGYDLALAPEEYEQELIQKIASMINEAIQNKTPGYVGWGYEPVSVGCQKRIVYANDTTDRTHKGHKYINKRFASFQEYDGSVDDRVQCLFTYDEQDELTGVLANVPCPAQCGEWLDKVSADYWGEVRKNLAKELGEGIYVLPLCGAAGEVQPRLFRYDGAEARKAKLKYGITFDPTVSKRDHSSINYLNQAVVSMKEIAEKVSNGIVEAFAWSSNKEPNKDMVSNYGRKVIGIGSAEYDEKRGIEDDFVMDFVYDDQDRLHNNCYIIPLDDPTVSCGMQVLAIGDIILAFSGFEMYSDFALRLQESIKTTRMIITQLAACGSNTYLAGDVDTAVYRNKKNQMLGKVGSEVYVHQFVELIDTCRSNTNEQGYIDQRYEKNLLNQLTLSIKKDDYVTFNDGIFRVDTNGKLKNFMCDVIYEAYRANCDKSNIVLQPGTYEIYGCQVRIGGKCYYGISPVDGAFSVNQFTLTEPKRLERVAIYGKRGVEYKSNQLLPFIVKR